MAGATIAPALPAMAAHFKEKAERDGSEVEFLVRLALTGPGLFTAIVSLFAGPLIDRIGRVPILLMGLVLYIIAGTSGLYLDDIHQLLVGRALLGVAVALVMVTTTTLIGDLYAGPARQRFTGFQSAFMSFGGVAFLLIAGFLADVGWRAPFGIYFAAGLVLVGTLVALRSGSGTGGPGASSVAGAQFVDEAGPAARTLATVLALGFVGMVLFYMIPTHVPFLLQELGVGEKKFGGIAIATNGLMGGIVAMNYGRIRSRLSFAAIAALMFIVMAAGYTIFWQARSYPVVLIGCVVNGLGQGLMLPNCMSWIQSIAPAGKRAKLSGALVSAVFLGQFLSPILTKPIGDRFGLSAEFGIAAGVMVGLCVVFAMLAGIGTKKG
jgi:MFS family permease